MITVSAELDAALRSEVQTMALLVTLPGGINQTDWVRPLTYDGQVYTNDGLLVGVDDVSRESGLKLHSHTITLSNVSQTALAAYANNDLLGRQGTIRRAFLDDDGEIIGVLVDYIGTLDSWAIAEDKNRSEMQLKLTSIWSAHNARAGRYTNPNSQEEAHPGDEFFEFAHEEKSAITWGRE